MIQCSGRARFDLESMQALWIGRDDEGKDFDRDIAVQARVARAIHFAHAARAEGLNNFVLAKLCARGQGHPSAIIALWKQVAD